MNSIVNTKLWTALITPMNEDQSINFNDLEILLKRQEASQNGILILGSTGEALLLSDKEKEEIINFVIDKQLQVPIMVGIPGTNTKSAMKWINYCNDLKVDAFLLVTPVYTKPGRHGQYQWFHQLLEKSKKPCMLYNVPSRAGISLNKDTLNDLKDHPNLFALKEASGSTQDFQEYQKSAPNISIFSGDDALTPDFSKIGCKGLVSVISNVWPEQTKKYLDKCLKQDFTNLKTMIEASNSMFLASNPIPTKFLLAEKKTISTSQTKTPLNSKDLSSDSREIIMKIDQQVENWK